MEKKKRKSSSNHSDIAVDNFRKRKIFKPNSSLQNVSTISSDTKETDYVLPAKIIPLHTPAKFKTKPKNNSEPLSSAQHSGKSGINVGHKSPTPQKLQTLAGCSKSDLEKSLNDNKSVKKPVYVIVDTNILMSDITVIDKLYKMKFYGSSMKIIIPYVVLKELDVLKTQKKEGFNAQFAIKWCNKYLQQKNHCIQGQPYEDYLLNETENETGDESIIHCCLSYQKKKKQVLLISNDINLRNRSLVANIKSYDSNKLKSLLEKFKKKVKIKSPTTHSKANFSDVSEESVLESPETSIQETENENIDDTCVTNVEQKVQIKSPIALANVSDVSKRHLSSPVVSIKNSENIVHNSNLSVVDPEVEIESPSSHSRVNVCDVSTEDVLLNPETGSQDSENVFQNIDNVRLSIVKGLGGVLVHAMQDAYGDVLWKQIIKHKPPWTAMQVLSCFEKHWIAVFIDKFSNNILDLIKRIKSCLLQNSDAEAASILSLLYRLFKKEPYRSIVNSIQESSDLPPQKEKSESHDNSKCGFETDENEEVYEQQGLPPTNLDTSVTQESPKIPVNVQQSAFTPESKRCVSDSVNTTPNQKMIIDFEGIKQSVLFVGRRTHNILYSNQSDQIDHSFIRSTEERLKFRGILVSFGFILIKVKNEESCADELAESFIEAVSEFSRITKMPFRLPCVKGSEFTVFGSSSDWKQFIDACLSEFEGFIRTIDLITNN